jgi:hypothetical protein
MASVCKRLRTADQWASGLATFGLTPIGSRNTIFESIKRAAASHNGNIHIGVLYARTSMDRGGETCTSFSMQCAAVPSDCCVNVNNHPVIIIAASYNPSGEKSYDSIFDDSRPYGQHVVKLVDRMDEFHSFLRDNFPTFDTVCSRFFYSCVVVYSIDRFSRFTENGLRDIRLLHSECDLFVHILTEPSLLVYDELGGLTPNSLCMTSIRLAMSTFERHVILSRTRAGLNFSQSQNEVSASLLSPCGVVDRRFTLCNSSEFHRLFTVRMLEPKCNIAALTLDIQQWLDTVPHIRDKLPQHSIGIRTVYRMRHRLYTLWFKKGCPTLNAWVDQSLSNFASA